MTTEDFQKQVLRELKDIKSEITLLKLEREILEDIMERLGTVSDKFVWHRQHLDNAIGNIKSDVKEGQISLEHKVDEIKKEVKEGNETTEKVQEMLKT